MGAIEKTKDDKKEARRNQILEAAMKVFARMGFNRARMDDIVEESGLSKGALYWYFKSKDDIITAILDRMVGRETMEMRGMLEDERPVREKLSDLLQSMIADITRMRPFMPILIEFWALQLRRKTIRQVIGKYYQAYIETLTPVIQQGIDRGEFRPVNAMTVSVALGAVVEGTILLWATTPEFVDLESDILEGCNLILDGLEVGKPGIRRETDEQPFDRARLRARSIRRHRHGNSHPHRRHGRRRVVDGRHRGRHLEREPPDRGSRRLHRLRDHRFSHWPGRLVRHTGHGLQRSYEISRCGHGTSAQCSACLVDHTKGEAVEIKTMELGPTIIETGGLTRVFKETRAVDALDLTIQRGELFGLVGPDGAGKTTTLRLLAGLLDISEGSATVAGYDLARQAEAIKTHIGYMAQEFSLYGELSVIENLHFFSEIFDVDTHQLAERTERLLQFAGLTDFRTRRAMHLSGGMQKKLALACTLIHEPDILLLDEPTTGVDPVSRREFWNILTELHLRGTTIVVSTPYMDEADRCSRVGLMYAGKLVICDEPHAIRNQLEGDLIELMPDDWREARNVLQALPGVLEIQTYGESLHLLVDSARKRIPEIKKTLKKHAINYRGLRLAPPRMEEAFISLIKRLTAEIAAAEED